MNHKNSNLIINADDYGSDSNINTAIAFCMQNNIINSTSIMVNTNGFQEAVELAYKFYFTDRIGIHLNLTHGKSLTDLSGTGLTDDNGFIRKSISKHHIFLSRTIRDRIENEIIQQYNKLLEANITPTHIDSHHSVHVLPWMAGIFLKLAKKEKLKIRLSNDRFRKNIIYYIYNKYINNVYRKNNLNFSDKLETIDSFIKHYNKEKDMYKVYEVLVHPTYIGDNIIDFVDNINLEQAILKLKQYL